MLEHWIDLRWHLLLEDGFAKYQSYRLYMVESDIGCNLNNQSEKPILVA